MPAGKQDFILKPTDQDALDNFESSVGFRLFAERKQLTLSLPEQIAAQLGDQIISGSMANGAHIPEQELAERYEVSRGPVREALRILEREGLVVVNPRRGASVSELNADELAEIFEVRSSLLSLAARKNAAAQNPELLKLLEHGIKKLASCIDTPADGSLYAETTYRLSLLSARYANNTRLSQIVTSLSLQTLRYSKLQFRSRERRVRSIEHWQRSLQACRAGDAELAAQICQQRIQESWDATLAALQAETH
ncbi:GntR family transcriptional regulator [Advenella kashmirensis WT001]|uniref:GntR family transcriptional regulator n=1 Tax=Advenella kashmirensis (strain DSM 17095 / LMG 22695 / WT001) TaxID=1036672 RepID=I3UAA3_ADVKW|nr:GntR family transcriptional regulator [Advenella kashmirensis WT001]